MAVAAIVAVIHDILVTVGIYSLIGFQVTPDTVIAVLTVLGYSLYDTVVVFDRIRENAKGLGASGRITYSDMVNLSMNQTLARSINTSLVAIIPVLSVLVVGSFILGATSLQDFGLALVIGLTSGAYSSIFIASPLLALMKEREPALHHHPPTARDPRRAGGVLTPAMPRPWPWPPGGERRPAAGPATRPRGHPPGSRLASRPGRRPGTAGGRWRPVTAAGGRQAAGRAGRARPPARATGRRRASRADQAGKGSRPSGPSARKGKGGKGGQGPSTGRADRSDAVGRRYRSAASTGTV